MEIRFMSRKDLRAASRFKRRDAAARKHLCERGFITPDEVLDFMGSKQQAAYWLYASLCCNYVVVSDRGFEVTAAGRRQHESILMEEVALSN